MNKKGKRNLRRWATALCAAALCLLSTQTAWGQSTGTTQGVKVGDNVTTVNNVPVTSGEIKGANSGTTVTVTVAAPSDGKVAVVTVSPTTIPATSVTALTPSATTVQKDNTFTVTATVSPAYADKLYWTVSDSENAGFVSGSTTVSTLETTVDASTGTTTATLKALASGTVTVSVKATSSATVLTTTSDITINALPPALPGKFTINADGDQVQFSQGNLTRESSKWAFLSNSWDYNTNPATDDKVNTTDGAQHFQWSVVFQSASSGESAVVSDITDDLGSGWRALSLAEWRYLLGYDEYNSGVQSSKRTVQWHYYAKISGADIGTGDKRYLLIFPDDFKSSDWNTTTMGTAPTNFDATADNSIAYTAENFTAMQSAGIVILPAAGYRNNSGWNYVGGDGYYWSCTSSSNPNAYELIFYNSSVCMLNYNKNSNYYPVRLVQDVVAAP